MVLILFYWHVPIDSTATTNTLLWDLEHFTS